jgi:hypothetical protein
VANKKVRVVVTINVPSDLEAELLVDNRHFMSMAGKAVQAVAAQTNGASPDPRWMNGEGNHVTAHIHDGNGCAPCRNHLYNDEIE